MADEDLDYGAMSDEDFEQHMNSLPAQEEAPSEPSSVSGQEADVTPEPEMDGESFYGEEGPEADTGEEEDSPDEGEVEEDPEAESEEEEESDEGGEEEDTSDAANQLAELFKPFKADGVDMQVKSVEEAKRLMSMGIGFHKKMEGFKPHRRTIKTLEANEIDEAKLNFLIDISKGNKDAIAKLLKDSGLNALDLETEEDSNYTPSNHQVADSAVELDEVIADLRSTPTFTKTTDIVSNQWDEASRSVFLKSPTLLRALNEQVSNGTYERVMTEVTRQRVFGNLRGLSDLEAYDRVGKQMFEAQATAPQSKPVVPVKNPPAKPTNTDRKRRASTRRKPAPAKPKEYDWASMSDEEFEKHLK